MKFDDLYLKHLGLTLIATAALSAIPAFGAEANRQDAFASNAESTTLALATTGQSVIVSGAAGGSGTAYPPLQAGVRKAAAEGPEALRRYVQRTRMIYNYHYWDFAPQE